MKSSTRPGADSTVETEGSRPRRALVIQHVEPENCGAIGRELRRRGVALDVRRTYQSDPLPADLSGHDSLVIMGGPMGAYSNEGFPTRQAELSLAREALAARIPTLGICLGAQLLAMAAGGGCHAGGEDEKGWGLIRFAEEEASADALFGDLPREGDSLREVEVFHWHSDTVSLPAGGIRLAGSPLYANQVFRLGACAWGLQCHPEVDEDLVAGVMAMFGHEVPDSEARSITDRTPAAVAALRPVQAQVFGRFADLVATQLLD